MLATVIGAFALWLTRLNGRLQASLLAEQESEGHLRILVAELNHRIKNVLTLVQSLARQSFGADNASRQAIETFNGRIIMLANASTLIADAAERPQLGELARVTVEPFGARLTFKGPEVQLGPKSAQLVALMLHELATNATKHGALGEPDGQAALRWSTHDEQLELSWTEQGSPGASPTLGKGFGARLLGSLVPRQLRGNARIWFEAEGLRYQLTAPLDALRD